MCGICATVSFSSSKEQNSGKTEDKPSTYHLLTNRGPDLGGHIRKSVNFQVQEEQSQIDRTITLDFHGRVLHLRGQATKQPIVDENGSILLWNGEIFGGNFQVSASQNDGDQLMSQLSKISSCSNQESFEENITKVFQDIHGPWAFIYWQNEFEELWFGRDFFGRRSLLWHFPNSISDGFALSSVAMKCSKKIWHEVPAAKLYKISLKGISRFYMEYDNKESKAEFYDLIQSKPLQLPKHDFGTSSECSDVFDVISTIERVGMSNGRDTEQMNGLFCDKDVNLRSDMNDGEPTRNKNSEISSNFVSSSNKSKCCFCCGIETIHELSRHFSEYKKDLSSELNNIGKTKELPDRDVYKMTSDSTPNPPIKCYCLHHMILPQLKSNPPDSEHPINVVLLEYYMKNFMIILEEAIRRRVYNLPRYEDLECSESSEETRVGNLDCGAKKLKRPKVGILFSGGIDCMTLAAMADRVLPEDEPIDLLNVAFAQQPRRSSPSKRKTKQKEVESVDPYNVPDRITGRSGVKELNPKRTWNFIEVNVTLEEVKHAREQRVQHLLNPLESVLDDSIGCAIWFAARGKGIQYQLRDGELVKCSDDYHSPVKVLLTGMGADEQLGGYARHRSKFEKFGWSGLESEIKMETERISSRNLGRDDRCISDHGREARFPFLDENVVSFLENVPIWIRCDPRLPRGHGEKRLLRKMAARLNLTGSVSLPKRAIQFGSRIAKLENSKEKGSDSCNRLAFST